jgi:dTDP-4-amino-4,6-dideoxygalactose transaminase
VPGTNGKMSEASAAMALTSLEARRVPVANRRSYDAYREALAGLPGVSLLAPAAGDAWNHYVVLDVSPLSPASGATSARRAVGGTHLRAALLPSGCHRTGPTPARCRTGRLP